jgi:hypothetical protein
MRKIVLSLAAAGAALAAASPAAAQYYPAPQPYGQPYGYGYGQNNWGQVRVLQSRIDRVERNIRQLDRRNVIRDRTADRLRAEADSVEHRLHRAARYGLNPYEANDIERRIFNLERNVRFALGNRWRNDWGFNGYNGYNHNEWRDRDRDGRNDRYEDDRGRDHDGRWERDRD